MANAAIGRSAYQARKPVGEYDPNGKTTLVAGLKLSRESEDDLQKGAFQLR